MYNSSSTRSIFFVFINLYTNTDESHRPRVGSSPTLYIGSHYNATTQPTQMYINTPPPLALQLIPSAYLTAVRLYINRPVVPTTAFQLISKEKKAFERDHELVNQWENLILTSARIGLEWSPFPRNWPQHLNWTMPLPWMDINPLDTLTNLRFPVSKFRRLYGLFRGVRYFPLRLGKDTWLLVQCVK